MDFIVVVGEQFQPMHLPMIQDLRFCKVLQILAVSEDVDQEMSLFEPVTPILETFHDCKSFFIRNPIILLCQIHGF